MRWALTLLATLPVLLGACEEESVPLSGNTDVVSQIPWAATEIVRYRLLSGDDIVGSGELRLRPDGDERIILDQRFEFPDEGITDTVSVVADADTLRPLSADRLIDGPEGIRRCEAKYKANAVTVDQKSKDSERTDKLDLPPTFYDTWSDLFLWRSLAFAEGFEVRYADVLSCSLAKPDLLTIVLKVKRVESVTVPAGTFDAWRLEIRSGGETQKAWYADDEARTLVRYDNGDLVFELESSE